MTKIEIRVAGRYKIERLRAVGSHSEVFEGVNTHTLEPVCLKMEYLNATPRVDKEADILKKLEGCIGIPLMLHYSQEGDYRILITELLGEDLGQHLKKCQGSFSLKTTLMIAD